MQRFSSKLSRIASSILVMYSANALATNGMNLEGYGPIATAMGGASMAYDNGTAAVMNNPTTLGLQSSNNRLDFALGKLGPDVTAKVQTQSGSMSADSSADAFYMPAIGWARKQSNFTYGIGIFAQGGMGTEYGSDSWLADPSGGNNSSLTSGLVNRSEVSVGRAIVPLVYSLSDNVHIGGSLDFVWAGMDIQMALSEGQFQNLANPQAQTLGNASGSMVDAFGAMYAPFGGSGINTLHHAYFDFSNNDDFTGEAMGTGMAGKLGITMRLTPKFTIGATYHSKTRLNDLEATGANLQMAVNGDEGALTTGTPSGTNADIPINVVGKVTVKDFEWPATVGFGAAMQATDKILLVADFKRIAWADVMEQFSMSFEADNTAANGGFAGMKMDMALYQEWQDQTVISVGGAYQATDALILRLGYNHASNPIPDEFLNPLFPAIVESHVTGGVGYTFGGSQLNFSLSKGLEVTATNSAAQVSATHAQLSWQLMYSYLF